MSRGEQIIGRSERCVLWFTKRCVCVCVCVWGGGGG